jgi:fructose-bisphosphate aldolase, class II
MPIATPAQYNEMLDAAQSGSYAYPAIRVWSLGSINAALRGLADKNSDGIIQVSLGGGMFVSGSGTRDPVLGATVLAEATHRLADCYDVLIALHTDHCTSARVDSFLWPLIEETARRRKLGRRNLFQSHMLDASDLPLEENMSLCRESLQRCVEHELIVEVETGLLGGVEDGVDCPGFGEGIHTTPGEMLFVHESLREIGRFLYSVPSRPACGAYSPWGHRLRVDHFRRAQSALKNKHGAEAQFDFVFHGGLGSLDHSLVQEMIANGVVKVDVGTKAVCAFTRPIADHVFKNYQGVLRVDGDVGRKELYDPRTYLRAAEAGMSDCVGQACDALQSAEKSLLKK